ncbi:MAG: ATP-binding protein [Acidobacteria bacterium]|nr:ATP-binding protein [Acidobacteriota bacterium]
MRRRSRRGANNSESTGKIGQELPQNQPRPLVPSYLDESLPQVNAAGTGNQRQERPPVQQREQQHPAREQQRPAREQHRAEWNEPVGSGRLEVETQPESPSVLPEAQTEKAEKAPRGYVVLAIGLPGSGKTTWFRRRGVTPLSSDLLRNILFDDVEEQKFQGLVFSTLRSLLRARLIAKMPWNYVDATNLSVHERRQWIKMSKSFGFEVQAVFFDVPLEVCLERNRSRDRMVSEDVMRKMAEKLKAPAFEEGFSKITVVRVKRENA